MSGYRMNIEAEVAYRSGGTDAYAGLCGELADNVLHLHPTAAILFVEPGVGGHVLPGTRWKYHMVQVVDGIVHDAWNPAQMLPPQEYAESVFGASARWSVGGVE